MENHCDCSHHKGNHRKISKGHKLLPKKANVILHFNVALTNFFFFSLMFAIPRLAIVYGLLICVEGPLNVDRSHSDFPSLFLPFKNLLRKIRELLQTLEPSEVLVLEMLLCQLEEPANISTKLKEVERMLENKEKSEGQVRINCDIFN